MGPSFNWKYVKYAPWIGANYFSSSHSLLSQYPKKRLLVLGESHYFSGGKSEQRLDFTQSVVKEFALSKTPGGRIFDGVTCVLLHEPKKEDVSAAQYHSVWNSIAFYNYIQVFFATKARQRPLPQHWRASERAFVEVIKNLTPTHIWVLGKSLWNNMTEQGFAWSGDILSNNEKRNTGIYSFSNVKARAVASAHPSSYGGFRKSQEIEVIKSFLSSEALS